MTTLTMKEEKRLDIIQKVLRGELTMAEAGLMHLPKMADHNNREAGGSITAL